MHLPGLLLLPFHVFESGRIAAGIIVSIAYVAMLSVFGATIYEIFNFVGVTPRVGEANVTKRIAPVHWEWQSRGRAIMRVYVQDYEVLDLLINGRKIYPVDTNPSKDRLNPRP
ncbi:hypothetical protein [Paraburkholderia sp. ZP32-5]|uniref:hypothetical protein n=1 Tax=Paraburkholderia sp. ZP32-5 TaxID=2883245 RepID=UPI001F47F4B4|nr:hypothetical protein [Paraburkholderia sp. ZP32-5]